MRLEMRSGKEPNSQQYYTHIYYCHYEEERRSNPFMFIIHEYLRMLQVDGDCRAFPSSSLGAQPFGFARNDRIKYGFPLRDF